MENKTQFFEYLIILYMALQYFCSFNIIFNLSVLIFLYFIKYHIEGFRLPTLLLIFFHSLMLCVYMNIIKFITLITASFVLVYYFPIFKYPNTLGKYKVGYKKFLKDHLRVAIFYPTYKQDGEDVLYYPHDEHWVRFYEVMKLIEVMSKGQNQYPIPKFIHKFVYHALEKQNLGVKLNANIINKNEDKFPVIIFSHGLSANRHTYVALAKEWTSHGFIVLTLEHDDKVLIDPTSEEHGWQLRKEQLSERIRYIVDLLNFVCDENKFISYVNEGNDNSNLKIDYNKIFIAGHSFGGATAAEVAVSDKRITGGAVLLDPWFEPCSEQVFNNAVSVPVLNVRSHDFEKNTIHRDLNLKHMRANSKNGRDNIISGYFQHSTHNSMTDLVLFMPRELALFKQIPNVHEIEFHLKNHITISTLFLISCCNKDKDKDNSSNKGLRESVLKQFDEYQLNKKKNNTFILDQ
jgi:predicted dienelactone hydrolase